MNLLSTKIVRIACCCLLAIFLFTDKGFAQSAGGRKVTTDDPKSAAPKKNSLRGARIFHGVFSLPSKWPWMVFIKIEHNKQCGGTLLSNEWVLTAAHCFDRVSPTKVVIGSIYKDESNDKNAVVRTVKQKCCHEDYNFRTWENDICLIKLSQPVQYSNRIKQATLPRENTKIPDDTSCTVLGWGLTEEFKLHSGLQEAAVKVINLEKCKSWYAQDARNIPANHLCAGHEEGGADTCGGDSGGPLVTKEGESFVIRGITSFGSTQCGSARRPGVYTRVSSYISWIRRKMRQPCFEPQWSEWSTTCSVTCGTGTQVRRRTCLDHEKHPVSNNRCPGQFVIYGECEQPCTEEKKEYHWGSWTIESPCSVTCGNGIETKRRECLDENDDVVPSSTCPGNSREEETCSRSPCQTYNWGNWNIDCSVTCGRGIETRTRECFDDDRNVVHSSNCGSGRTRMQGRCTKPECPVQKEYHWGSWTIESPCSVTCGNGIETKTRECLDENDDVVPSSNCPGNSREEETCRRPACLTYRWGPLKVECSVTCGRGIETRTRQCMDSNNNVVDASMCGSGQSTVQRRCFRPNCPKKPEYHWGPWQSRCSVTCGNGIETKTRECLDEEDNVVSSSNCIGDSREDEECSRAPCQTYKWGRWNIACSVTCGNGIETRTRDCLDSDNNVVVATLCGSDRSTIQRKCSRPRCVVESEYRWSDWDSSCTVTCGTGVETKTRSCLDVDDNVVSDFYCSGRSVERGTCNRPACPKSFYWGPWNRECSVTCGVGVETMTRDCIDSRGNTAHPSRCQPGKNKIRGSCYRPSCKQEYHWGAWEETACPVTCGGGQHIKFRACQDRGGNRVDRSYCHGSDLEQVVCGTQKCPDENSTDFYWGDWRSWSNCRSRGGCNGFRYATRYCLKGNQDVAPQKCIGTIGGDDYKEETCRPLYC